MDRTLYIKVRFLPDEAGALASREVMLTFRNAKHSRPTSLVGVPTTVDVIELLRIPEIRPINRKLIIGIQLSLHRVFALPDIRT